MSITYVKLKTVLMMIRLIDWVIVWFEFVLNSVQSVSLFFKILNALCLKIKSIAKSVQTFDVLRNYFTTEFEINFVKVSNEIINVFHVSIEDNIK